MITILILLSDEIKIIIQTLTRCCNQAKISDIRREPDFSLGPRSTTTHLDSRWRQK